MSAGNGATSYFGPPEATAREKDAPPRPAESYASSTVGLTESMKKRAEQRAAKKERKIAKKAKDKEVKAISQSLAKLARQADHDRQQALIDSIALRGLEDAHGLFLKPGDEGYNADAVMPLADASTRTHFGMKVYQQMMAKQREGMATERALAVVMVQGRLNEQAWNAEAKRVDEDQRKAQAIDVAAEMIRERGDE